MSQGPVVQAPVSQGPVSQAPGIQGRGLGLFTGLFTGLVFASLMLGWPITGRAEPVVTVHADGVIDWSARVVRVVGVGTPRVLSPTGALTSEDLEASARNDAVARMARALADVPFDSGRSLGSVAAFDTTREAAARGIRVGAARHFSDGTVHVPAEVDFPGIVDAGRAAALAAAVGPAEATGWVVVLSGVMAPTLRVELRGAGVTLDGVGAMWVRDRGDVPAGFLGDRPRTIGGRAVGSGVIEVGEDAADLLAGGRASGRLVIVLPAEEGATRSGKKAGDQSDAAPAPKSAPKPAKKQPTTPAKKQPKTPPKKQARTPEKKQPKPQPAQTPATPTEKGDP